MTARACPVCTKPATPAHRPFCSRRCADVDLQRWFSGAYVVPAAEGDASEAGGDGAMAAGALDTLGRAG